MLEKKPKDAWKPTDEQLNPSTLPFGVPGNALTENDPSLDQVMESMVRLGGSKHRAAREKRIIARHLTPKARAHKKARRRLRRDARRTHPSNRGKAQGGWQ